MIQAENTTSSRSPWPSLRGTDWTPTRETLHMWLQIVGKVRLAKAPMVNHWWQVPLYVTPRGLSTTSIPDGDRAFEMELNFCTHELTIDLEGGDRRVTPRTTRKPLSCSGASSHRPAE